MRRDREPLDTGRRRSTRAGARAGGQRTRAPSRTIRRLLVRASSRSIAAATSLGGDSLDQRLPTRRTSPSRSSSSSRGSTLSPLDLPPERPSPSRTSPAACPAPLVSDPGAERAAARRTPLRPRDSLTRDRDGFQRGRRTASDRRIIPETASAAAAQDDRLSTGRADELKPTPSTTGAADAAAPSGVFYLDQLLGTQQRYPLTIERRSRRLRKRGALQQAARANGRITGLEVGDTPEVRTPRDRRDMRPELGARSREERYCAAHHEPKASRNPRPIARKNHKLRL